MRAAGGGVDRRQKAIVCRTRPQTGGHRQESQVRMPRRSRHRILICDFESTPLFSSPIISAKNPKDCCELNHPAGPAESQTIQSGAAGGRADSFLLSPVFCLLSPVAAK